ncbi:hypothetical protein [Bifidobacterium sp. SO1]|uniref:hypothetical protein n=1 Tax=Bifidobacterium sp. SO1 TaxID=2809029 RepID=UPI001BDD0AFF|nr:hypothetical protein [Bifidobacterium sp. SO1]MBT1160305.1 hypothetical protein [Bifidobacterium sp. SO1]
MSDMPQSGNVNDDLQVDANDRKARHQAGRDRRSHANANDRIPPDILAQIPSWKPTIWTFLVPAVLAVTAAIGGYLLGGVQAISSDVCLSDAIYQVNGRAPSYVDYPQYDGPQLTGRKAATYYAKAVAASWQPVQDALPTFAGNDLAAIHEQAGTVAKALHRTYAMLLERTWPDSVTDALDDVVKQYGNLEQSARYTASSIDVTDAHTLLSDLISFSNHTDAALRDDLGLPAGEPFTPPYDIVAVTDQGIYDAAANGDDRTINDGQHIVDVTVRSRIPGTVTSISLELAVHSAIGRNVGTANGGVDSIMLAQGQSVVVPVPIDPDLATSGASLSLRTLWTHSGRSSVTISLDGADGSDAAGDDSDTTDGAGTSAGDPLGRPGALADFRLR